MHELISIIINVYNGEKFIKKCLDSIINQTYNNLEILVINDGSTDNTLKIIKRYKDKRIKIITTKNNGLSISRNIGIEKSTGKYLYFIDADDFIDNDTIEYLYNLSKKYNSDLTTCNPLTIFDYNFIKDDSKEEINIIDNKEMLKKVLLSENVAGAIWNKLIDKRLFDDIRFENRIINDIVVTYRIVIKANKIVYSNQKKYYYLKHRNAATISGYKKTDRCIDFYKASKERYDNIKKIYPDFIENDIGLIRNMYRIYIMNNKEVEEFLKKEKALDLYKKMFSIKMLKTKINIKEKIKLILFRINPNLFKRIGLYYRKKKYNFKY